MARNTNFEVGLAAYYRMDEGAADTPAVDNEPGGFDLGDGLQGVGTFSPGWSGTTRGPLFATDRQFNRTVGASEPWDTVIAPNKSISFFTHVFHLTTSASQGIWSVWGATTADEMGYCRWEPVSGTFQFFQADGAGSGVAAVLAPSPTPPNGRWIGIGGSYDGVTNTLTIYVDGGSAQVTGNGSWGNSNRGGFFLCGISNTNFLDGYIDEFGWWDGVAFSPAQLEELDGLTRGSFTVPGGDEGASDGFVVETGVGLANATSYAGVDGFRNYYSLRGIPLPDESTKSIKGSLVQATDFLDRRYRNRFIGIRLNTNQSLEFPRVNAFYQDGRIVSGVPIEIEQATYELAFRAMSARLTPDPTYDDSNRVVVEKEEVIGPLKERTVFSSRDTSVLNYRKYPELDGLLRELVTEGQVLERV